MNLGGIRLHDIGRIHSEELLTQEDQVTVIEPATFRESEPRTIRGAHIEEVVITVIAWKDLSVSSAHEAVSVKDDVTLFASEVSTSFREAIDVLRDVADTDLYEFEIAAAGRGTHIARAIDAFSFCGDDLFEAFEPEEFASGQEAVARGKFHLATGPKECAIEAVEVFDEETAILDDEPSVTRREARIGGETGIAVSAYDCFIVLERDADAVRTIFVNRDEGDVDVDALYLDLFKDVLFGVITEVRGALTAIAIGTGIGGAATSAFDFILANLLSRIHERGNIGPSPAIRP